MWSSVNGMGEFTTFICSFSAPPPDLLWTVQWRGEREREGSGIRILIMGENKRTQSELTLNELNSVKWEHASKHLPPSNVAGGEASHVEAAFELFH